MKILDSSIRKLILSRYAAVCMMKLYPGASNNDSHCQDAKSRDRVLLLNSMVIDSSESVVNTKR